MVDNEVTSAELLQETTKMANPRDPVMHLASEIVSEIFIQCLPDPFHLPLERREFAISTPALWMDLVFHVKWYNSSGFPTPPAWIRTYISQTADTFTRRARHLYYNSVTPQRPPCAPPDLIIRIAHRLQELQFEILIPGHPRVADYMPIFSAASNILKCSFSCFLFDFGDSQTPSDVHVTLPPAANSCSAPQGSELSALLLRSLPPLVDLDLFTGDSSWAPPTIETCLRSIPTLSHLTLRGAENLFQEDFIAVLADAPSNCLLPKLTHLLIYVEDSLPDEGWFQQLIAMLRVRRIRADSDAGVKLRSFTLKFKGEFYFGNYHPYEDDMKT
ncbi:hypothetical protein K438DRAFT_1834159, partial [Mycena galopus ATCC 62051]